MAGRMRNLLLATVVCLLACGGETTTGGEGGGLPVITSDCPAGQLLNVSASGCIPAGTAVGDCGAGFIHDGDVGCEPVLPAERCPPAMMAVPGDEACHPLMDCGSGKWGTLLVDASTVYVDASASAAMSDGSESQPWTTIGEALLSAPAGELVAVAAGTYNEDITINAPVRLWGVCPDQVSVVGSGAPIASVVVLGGDGTQIGGISVSGPSAGIGVSGVEQVSIERVRVFDAGVVGIDVVDDFGATDVRIENVLIENSGGTGLRILRSSAVILSSVIRLSDDSGVTLHQADAEIDHLVVEDNHDVGIRAAGTRATVSSTVVRGTEPTAADQLFGRGVSIVTTADDHLPSNVSIEAVLVEDSHDVGVLIVGSDANIHALRVRDTQPQLAPPGDGGYGINIQIDEVVAQPSIVTVRTSVIERSFQAGVRIAGALATLESVVVRDTQPIGARFGYGVMVQSDVTTLLASEAGLIGNVIDGSHEVGVLVIDSYARIDRSLISGTVTTTDGLAGDGIVVLSLPAPAAAEIIGTVVSDSPRAGLANFGATVAIEGAQLRCSAFDLNGEPYSGMPFVFEDRGGNRCGCPESGAPLTLECKAISAGIAPLSAPE
jgi:hypothetical protein